MPTVTPTGVAQMPQLLPRVGEGIELLERYRAEIIPDAVSIYPLEGRLDRPLSIEVMVLSGDIDPVLEIYTMEGHQLVIANSSGVGEPEKLSVIEFPADGYYELGISSEGGSGEVGISVYGLEGQSSEGGGSFYSFPGEMTGKMADVGTVHMFRIPAQRGERFDAWAQAVGDELDLFFDLYDPDGHLVAARDDNVGLDPYLWNFMADRSGIYSLALKNYGTTIGDYVLRVDQSSGGELVSFDEPISFELQASPRRSAWFAFDCRASEPISIEARPQNPELDFEIALYDQNGNRLLNVNNSSPGQPEILTFVQLPYDGRYQVEFFPLETEGLVEFTITHALADVGEIGAPVEMGGVPLPCHMDGPGTLLSYTFEAEAGDTLNIGVRFSAGVPIDLNFDLYDPDGYLLASSRGVEGAGALVQDYSLPVAGSYVMVFWNQGQQAGDFEVDLSCSVESSPGFLSSVGSHW
ncbi:MAG: hypothetical protein JXJ17_01975 [Anaerolineae bacterium]|nr:hypothetical protein [Anaerolineae bacterium]